MHRALTLVLVATIWVSIPVALAQERPQAIDWKHLIPKGYDPDELVRKYQHEVSTMRDNDPRAERAAERLRRAWENAPVVESLNNKTVKLAGFLVTLEGDGREVSEFLLVPYFGACIHVPPPPSNQVVLVRTGSKPYKANQMFDMVSVTGLLRTERAHNDLASASYVIEATRVEIHKP
ncbi:MAG TPA: DUF3299 domain-containing protein [Candidatus Nitrosotalea sp.]|jgi:hypothetical protein|nr:DUF3299 domain-containing protein [Candidatus Nitrosotalea sp.]